MDYIIYYSVEGGEIMKYKKILREVAREYNTTPEEVDSEIRAAIKAAGLNMSPQLFISMCATKVKKDYIS